MACGIRGQRLPDDQPMERTAVAVSSFISPACYLALPSD
jgi:hypothetical protein